MKTISFKVYSDEDPTIQASFAEYHVKDAEYMTVDMLCKHFARFLVTAGYAHYDIVALRDGETVEPLYEG